MSAPTPFEEVKLRRARAVLKAGQASCGNPSVYAEFRFRALEYAAAACSGLGLDVFTDRWRDTGEIRNSAVASVAKRLVVEVRALQMHPALALASLSRPETAEAERRMKGVYYTDSRLARYLSSGLRMRNDGSFRVLDPASGTGVLLVATVLELAQKASASTDKLIGEAVCAADLSATALRGVFLSLASLTRSKSALEHLASRLRQFDSLATGIEGWVDVAPDGFEIVIGNPPWEKLKLTRHEWLRANGVHRHYGDDYRSERPGKLMRQGRAELGEYVKRVKCKFEHQGVGEHDLYKLFLELAMTLARPNGQVALLVPAGLIRSKGTQALREFLLAQTSDLDVTIFANRPRYFAIDTRFKFLALRARTVRRSPGMVLRLRMPAGERTTVRRQPAVVIKRTALRAVRADLSIPEVRTRDEWRIFRDLAAKGRLLRDPASLWCPRFMREVDMTRDRSHFRREPTPDAVSLIEGRMVHQFRCSAKRYVSGTGRRALWQPVETDDLRMRPQFYFPIEQLPDHVRERVAAERVGFCDITGQTNERTMLASLVPSGVVCGNKVPTILFEGDRELALAHLWLAMVNSFTFDWLLRRVVTTTVNYFLLLDLPLPVCSLDGAGEQRLIDLSRRLTEGQSIDAWERAQIRAEMDWRVLAMFGHDVQTLRVLVQDFPLLDRSQRPLPGEAASTITRDVVLLRAAENLGGASPAEIEEWRKRVSRGKELGAKPFVPTHLAVGEPNHD